jgi:iron(III) transport system ATP-binding protein
MTTVLTVEDLYVSYGANEVLKGVSLNLGPGEVVALLGPSGSGKTTLLRAVAGLEAPGAGRIRLGSVAVFDAAAGIEVPPENRNLGLVFQSYALWPHKSVFDNVAYGLRLRHIAAGEIRLRLEAVLRQLGLEPLAARLPHQLSGGQQQRVALARALVYNPPLILLDEPLSNLDAKLREEARAWLRELINRLGLSALCVTHDQREAMAIADRILLLSQGRIEQQGTPGELYDAPATLFAAEFMGSNNRFEGRLAELREGRARIEGPGWSLWGRWRGPATAAPGGPATALIRIERTRFGNGGEQQLRARLATSMFLGDRWEHLFRVDDLALRAYSTGPHSAAECWLELPPDDVWVFAA